MLAVQRLYESQEAQKEKRDQINARLIEKIAPFKPITYSKKPDNYPGAPGMQKNYQHFINDTMSQTSGVRVD